MTNRHVLLGEPGHEAPPSKITLNLRKIDDSKGLVWDPVTIAAHEFDQCIKFHPDRSVDVATINIAETFISRIEKDQQYLGPRFISSDNFAGKNKINVEASSDVLVVGYPRGFYDDVNLFPIVKSGIVASGWGVGFKGNPYFLIDAKLFPGSSGSVVISKPTDLVIEDGKIMINTEKQFAFLGIFSGEPKIQEYPVTVGDLTITQSSGFNLGIVWYAYLVEEIIEHGISLTETLKT